jgi:hypothetical protein
MNKATLALISTICTFARLLMPRSIWTIPAEVYRPATHLSGVPADTKLTLGTENEPKRTSVFTRGKTENFPPRIVPAATIPHAIHRSSLPLPFPRLHTPRILQLTIVCGMGVMVDCTNAETF